MNILGFFFSISINDSTSILVGFSSNLCTTVGSVDILTILFLWTCEDSMPFHFPCPALFYNQIHTLLNLFIDFFV